MSEETNTPDTEQPEDQPKPRTMQEMIASVDLAGATPDTIIIELIGEIQKLAFSATIALGLLERLKTEGNEEPAPEQESVQ